MYCYCGRNSFGYMVACDRCDVWFHGKCVGITPTKAQKLDDWLCFVCKRLQSEEVKMKQFINNLFDKKIQEYNHEHQQTKADALQDALARCNSMKEKLTAKEKELEIMKEQMKLKEEEVRKIRMELEEIRKENFEKQGARKKDLNEKMQELKSKENLINEKMQELKSKENLINEKQRKLNEEIEKQKEVKENRSNLKKRLHETYLTSSSENHIPINKSSRKSLSLKPRISSSQPVVKKYIEDEDE